jgi:hypothetical protein
MATLRDDWRAVLDWHCYNETADDWLARAGDSAPSLLVDLMADAGPRYDAAADQRPGVARKAEDDAREAAEAAELDRLTAEQAAADKAAFDAAVAAAVRKALSA